MTEERNKGGRPRDSEVTRRVLAAAVQNYGDDGWKGYSINEVARRSGVSKRSIYLRWSDKEELLGEALGAAIPVLTFPEGCDFHEARQRLIDHGIRRAELYMTDAGRALYRLNLDAQIYPEVFRPVVGRSLLPALRGERRAVDGAIEQGALPRTVSRVHLLEAVEGDLLLHIFLTPPELMDRMAEQLPAYIERMVDIQLGVVKDGRDDAPPS